MCFPNKTLFKLFKDEVSTTPIYVSKTSTMKDLETKIQRVLNYYMYSSLKRRDVFLPKPRLWRANSSVSGDLDQKYVNYTHVKIDATVLNLSEEQRNKQMVDVDLADTDTLIVEIPKDFKTQFVFSPNETEEDNSNFEDPLANLKVHSNNIPAISNLELN